MEVRTGGIARADGHSHDGVLQHGSSRGTRLPDIAIGDDERAANLVKTHVVGDALDAGATGTDAHAASKLVKRHIGDLCREQVDDRMHECARSDYSSIERTDQVGHTSRDIEVDRATQAIMDNAAQMRFAAVQQRAATECLYGHASSIGSRHDGCHRGGHIGAFRNAAVAVQTAEFAQNLIESRTVASWD